jgi:hypothetical protein
MLHRRGGANFLWKWSLAFSQRVQSWFHLTRESLGAFWQTPKGVVMYLFTEKCLLFSHSTIKAWLMKCCRDGCPSGRFYHLHRGTLEFHRVLGHLPDQGPSPPIAQFGRTSSSRLSLSGSKQIWTMIEATVFLGTFNAADIFWYPSPDRCLNKILSLSSTDSSVNLMVWFLTCTVNCGSSWLINWIYHRWTPSCRIILKTCFHLFIMGYCV